VKGLLIMARKTSGKRGISRWMAVGAVGAVAAAGIGLGSPAARAATGPSWSTVGPKAVGGTFSAVTSVQWGPGTTSEWAFASTAALTDNKGYPSVWSRTGTESWARTNLAGSAPGETFVSATAINNKDVLAFSTLPNGTSREWQFNGSTWKAVKTFDGVIGGASVTGPTNVWVFGSASASTQLGVYHYNGTTWTKVASTLHGGQGLSASDAWAYTGTTVAHWDGKSWTGTNLARLFPGRSPQIADVYDTDGTVYAIAESSAGAAVVLVYNGHSWALAGQVANLITLPNQVSSDGDGGVWFPLVNKGAGPSAEVGHYIRSVNKLTATALPTSATSITRVDRTFELIGGAVSSGKSDPAIYLALEYYN
jgi:hypothetical protein